MFTKIIHFCYFHPNSFIQKRKQKNQYLYLAVMFIYKNYSNLQISNTFSIIGAIS